MIDASPTTQCPGCGYPLQTGEHAPDCTAVKEKQDATKRETIINDTQIYIRELLPERYRDQFPPDQITAADVGKFWLSSDEDKKIAYEILAKAEAGAPNHKLLPLLNQVRERADTKRMEAMRTRKEKWKKKGIPRKERISDQETAVVTILGLASDALIKEEKVMDRLANILLKFYVLMGEKEYEVLLQQVDPSQSPNRSDELKAPFKRRLARAIELVGKTEGNL